MLDTIGQPAIPSGWIVAKKLLSLRQLIIIPYSYDDIVYLNFRNAINPMTEQEFDTYCSSLRATTNVIQWGNSSVWKIGGKIFAICSIWGEGQHSKISFKCSDLSYQILTEQDGIVPAPYLARAKWVQLARPDAMSDQDIKDYIRTAYEIVSKKLTKTLQKELDLIA